MLGFLHKKNRGSGIIFLFFTSLLTYGHTFFPADRFFFHPPRHAGNKQNWRWIRNSSPRGDRGGRQRVWIWRTSLAGRRLTHSGSLRETCTLHLHQHHGVDLGVSHYSRKLVERCLQNLVAGNFDAASKGPIGSPKQLEREGRHVQVDCRGEGSMVASRRADALSQVTSTVQLRDADAARPHHYNSCNAGTQNGGSILRGCDSPVLVEGNLHRDREGSPHAHGIPRAKCTETRYCGCYHLHANCCHEPIQRCGNRS